MQRRSFVGRIGLALLVVAAGAQCVSAQLPFFPGAEGFGGSFTGTPPAGGWFSNADVYHVTTTEDLVDPNTGKAAFGTLRGAFLDYTNPNSPKQRVTNRIVVFDVGGTFQLTQGKLDIKEVNNIYIAGHTAPSPVTVYGNMTQITKSSNTMTSNVILRYMTFRKGTTGEDDAISFTGGDGPGETIATNMILDHVSASWATDENLSVANNNTNVTVQYSIIADALTPGHAYGSLIRPRVDANITFHHNLYANNLSRQARFGTYNGQLLTAEFRNNVIYNWRQRASYSGGSGEPAREFADINYVGNYLIAGPDLEAGYSATQVFAVDKNIDTRIYQAGNFVDSDRQLNPGGVPNGSLAQPNQFVVSSNQGQTLQMMGSPFPTVPATTQPAAEAYSQLMQYVGNFWWARDAIDQRIISNVLNNTGPPGGVAASSPNAAELALVTGAPMVSHMMSTWDSDGDGMPNHWELAHGLDPNSALDGKLDFDSDGYVNVVEYLNEAGEFPAPAPIVWTGGASTRYAQIGNWRTSDGVTAGSNWQPSKYDTAIVHAGTAVVDAIGQHAGTLQLAPAAGDNATLNVTAGWLNAAETIQAGVGGSATINHSGGTVLAGSVVLGAQGVYNLSGSGVLRTGALTRTSPDAEFNMTGGTLAADVVSFSLTNNGGTIAAGASPGVMHVMGDLTLNSGVLEIEIGGTQPGQYDEVFVDGLATLGGTLKVSLVDIGDGVPTPTLGFGVPFLHSAGTAEGFAAFDLPPLEEGLSWALVPSGTATILMVVDPNARNPADFNNDGRVDGEDLAIWTSGFGLTGQPDYMTGDANGDQRVDGVDFLAWQENFGAGAGAAQASLGVPEPSAWVLALGLALGGAVHGRGRRRARR